MNRLPFKLFVALMILSFFCSPLFAITESDIPINKCGKNRQDKRQGEIAICAMFRDEANYMLEWIEFHRMIGVSHFYLYNNMSNDHYWTILQPYVKEGIVELFDVPFDSYAYDDAAVTHNFVQVTCYNHAINLAKEKNKWLAIIDLDEFLCPVIDVNLSQTLSRYDDATGLAVYWQVYGTSNIWELKSGELMIEKLLYREPNLGGNGLFKSIVKPQYAHCHDPHWTKVNAGYMLLPNRQQFSHTPNFSSLPVDIIRINHYKFRTTSHFENITKPRRARWGYQPSEEQWKGIVDYANSEYDPVMLKFVNKLKYKLRHSRL